MGRAVLSNIGTWMATVALSRYVLAFRTFFPAGSVLAGAVAEVLGPGPTAVIGGVACGLWGAGLLWRSRGPAAQPGVAAVEPAP